MRQLILNIRPHVECRLDNFVPGDNADLLAALAQQLARRDGSVLYLWGEAGSGRSHLLHAAVAAAHQRPAQFIAADAWQTPIETDGALIVVDDVQATDAEAQGDIFRALIRARDLQSSLIIAGDAPAHRLPIRDDVSSRIAQGLTFEIKPLADEQKAATLLQHARSRGMTVGPEIVNYLLRHGRRDLPWLMAVLDALDEASLSLSRPVTLPLLRDIIKDATPAQTDNNA
ncbi:DnaA regulatory inactivator Hda [Uliginosibacterium sp. sgz301328]|uniref:DnaA regulatory inactivator Hda n=1 Tax=Uliginosibacterium sp. sgz301328 TaxID=3243764 RepID=UPI00359D4FCA